MPKLAILIAASANSAFYSQIAAISMALRKLPWKRWEPKIHAFLGDHDAQSEALLQRWLPYLYHVELHRVSTEITAEQGVWGQCDALMRHAPRDAEVLMMLDADTLPVAPFEEILDRVIETGEVAGVMAHTCFPPGGISRQAWDSVSQGLLSVPLAFAHQYSLVDRNEPQEHREAPFYLNGGVVVISQASFGRIAPRYLQIRSLLMDRMEFNDFSSQVAFTLVLAEAGLPTWELPMRYNFPNDPRAERLQAGEMEDVVIHHYQHRGQFDRHQIFASPKGYEDFMKMPLSGINHRFQDAVRRLLGESYPFPAITGSAPPPPVRNTVEYHRQVPGFFYEGDYRAVDQIVADLPVRGNLIEVGCLMGRSTTAWAESLAKTGKQYAIHVIDSFTATYREYAEHLQGDPDLIRQALLPHRSQESLFLEYTRGYPNISYTKMHFSTSFQWDQALHCVFEDSDHDPTTLAQALPFWWDKIEPGGILCGHDYHADHAGVIAEVDALARTHGVAVTTYPDSSIWSIRKPRA